MMKGVAANSAAALVLGVLVLGVMGFSVAGGGDLAQALEESFNRIMDSTDFTVDLEGGEEGKETLSDAAKFAYQRANNDGCLLKEDKQKAQTVPNENKFRGGYPGLKESYIGKFPDCHAATSTGLRGPRADPNTPIAGQQQGQDMEGLVSRVQFKVTGEEPIVLEKGGGTWLEKNMLVASGQGFNERVPVKEECNENLVDIVADLTAVPDSWTGEPTQVGTGSKYVFYFREPEDGGVRTSTVMETEIKHAVYCRGFGGDFFNTDVSIPSPVESSFAGRGDIKIKLCPGDEGYVQMNKGHPHNTAEAAEKYNGEHHKFPFIEVTDATRGGECEPLQDRIPDDATTEGNILQLNMDVDKSYPKVGEFRLFDREEDFDIYNVNPIHVNPPAESQCKLLVRENDISVPDDGSVTFRSGAMIERGGKFPESSSLSVIDTSLPDGNLDTGVSSELDSGDVYDALVSKGFNSGDVSKDVPLLVSVGGQTKFELYGDMLCGRKSFDTRNKWLICDETVFGSETSVEFDGQEWRCRPESGEWKQLSSGDSSLPEDILRWDVFNPPSEEPVVLEIGQNSVTFRPGESPSSDYIKWKSSIGGGEKTVTLELRFQERGHLQIDASNEDGDTVTYLNTDKNGREHLWIMKESGYEDTGFDYKTGTKYRIELEKNQNNLEWRLFAGGSKVWSQQVSGSDFSSLGFESWNSGQPPVVEILEVSVSTPGDGGGS